MRHIFLPIVITASLGAGGVFAQQAAPPGEGNENTGNTTQVIEPETTEAEAGTESAPEGAGEAPEGEVKIIEAAPPAEGNEDTGNTTQVIEPETTEAEAGTESAPEGAGEVPEGEVQTIEVETVEEGEAETAETVAVPEEMIAREQAPNELRVDWITDTTVRSPEGETIGEVDDLILDRETGQLTAAVLGVGGFLGIGEKKIAVNWSELQIDYDANEITMNLTRDEADAAEEYVFRTREAPPPPAPVSDTGIGTGMGGSTTGGVGTGGVETEPVRPVQ